MGKLYYLITASLDGYIADKNGNFDWAQPTEEVHLFINDVVRGTGTFLYGRKMYETMAVWDDIPSDGDSPAMNDFVGIWDAASKIIYSKSLHEVKTANTTLESDFDLDTVKQLVAASDQAVCIGGPHLAAEAIKAGIIDDYYLFIVPVLVGNGNHGLPAGAEAKLELVDERRFENGTVYLHYTTKQADL